MKIVRKIIDAWNPEPEKNLGQVIRFNCAKFDLDPKLVASIIYQESLGDPNASRFEDGFYDKLLKNKTKEQLSGYVPNFPPTLTSEKRARSESYGVMQVMGETARMMGFNERWLHKVRYTENNVYIGCKYLRHLFDKAANISGGKEKLIYVLTKWNGSSSYPAKIFDHMEKERWRSILN